MTPEVELLQAAAATLARLVNALDPSLAMAEDGRFTEMARVSNALAAIDPLSADREREEYFPLALHAWEDQATDVDVIEVDS